MKQHLCTLIESHTLWSQTHLLTFGAPDLANAFRPAQFALVCDPGSYDPYLRRVAWFYAREGSRISFAMESDDALVARARVGDVLDLLAPLGHALEFDASARRIALFGDDTRIARLVPVAHDAIARGCEVVMAHRANTPAPASGGGDGEGVAFPVHLLSPEIEFRTDADALAEVIAWADAVVASGSDVLRQSLAETIRLTRYRLNPGFARVLMDVAMPCGTGVCYACAMETSSGLKRVCVDGPAFDLTWFDKRSAR
ncbi:MAG: hypothetical protein HY868_04470 [Chloroflexi bacterium]|nr:hypothetical protein [Chloroflexota bacterium]